MSDKQKDLNACFRGLDDVKLLAICLYGESRGSSPAGKLGVASVIMNRVRKGGWFGSTIKSVILKDKQFSCFNPGDPNRLKLTVIAANWDNQYQKDKALRDCYFIAENVVSGDMPSNVFDATYYNTKRCDPTWDDKMKLVAVIGNHEFFAEA